MSIVETNGIENKALQQKYIEDYDDLAKIVEGCKVRHQKVAVTIGSWDLLHIGHLRYLTNGRAQGDILVVGVDTDENIKRLKGDLRPVVPYKERVEMLAYQSCVDLITPIPDLDVSGNWQYGLLKKIRPDVFVAEETSYSDHQLTDIQEYCGGLVVLPRQAQGTSTSQMVQDTVKKHLDEMYKLVTKR